MRNCVCSGCLLGNNSIIDTLGLSLPKNTWVSACSRVTSASITSAALRPPHPLGVILCGKFSQLITPLHFSVLDRDVTLGHPVAAPFPVVPSALLSSSTHQLMHPITCGFISCIWAFLIAPALCPGNIEVFIVYILVINTSWTFSSMLLLLVLLQLTAFVCSTISLIAFECISARIVVHGAHYEMFSLNWWAFHWCDMFRSKYQSTWPQFFADSPIFTWFMRSMLGARVGTNVVISEPHLNEPQLQAIMILFFAIMV